MSLDDVGLLIDLDSLMSEPPETRVLCATAWADAMEDYAGGVVPTSTAVTAATATLDSALASAFDSTDAAATAASMEAAFAAFAVTVGAGMAPAFVATPPPGSVGFSGLFATPFPATHAIAALSMRNAIDDWIKTGLAQVDGGPPPPPVNWS